MKATIVVETIILCLIITLFMLFTIDAATIRKAELTAVASIEVQNTVESFFDGYIEDIDLATKISASVMAAIHSDNEAVTASVSYADADLGVADVSIEITYKQPNGRPRVLSTRRVYIREKQDVAGGEPEYSFIRNIDANYYKDGEGAFVDEALGGVKEDSIWKTGAHEAALDEIFGLAN